MGKFVGWIKHPLVLVTILYLLFYALRFQQAVPAGRQGGWEIEINLFHTLRQTLGEKIDALLPSPKSQLLFGILLGEKKELPAQIKLALRDTSTLHIVVVSGQNLSILAGFFWALSGLIKRRYANILALLATIFYTLLTGAQVPVLRAMLMVSLAMFAQSIGRPRDGFWVLMMTAGLMLLVNPRWIIDLSFQLSFMATMGLIVVAPILLKWLKSFPLIGQDLAITSGAQLMVVPIIAQYFHQFSLVGILTNVLVGWTIPIVMILGVPMLVFSFISQFLAQFFALLINILLTYFIYIVQFFASLPFAWEYVGEQVWIVWLGYYLILAAVVLSLNNGKAENLKRP